MDNTIRKFRMDIERGRPGAEYDFRVFQKLTRAHNSKLRKVRSCHLASDPVWHGDSNISHVSFGLLVCIAKRTRNFSTDIIMSQTSMMQQLSFSIVGSHCMIIAELKSDLSVAGTSTPISTSIPYRILCIRSSRQIPDLPDKVCYTSHLCVVLLAFIT
jgi:hypothetical protein